MGSRHRRSERETLGPAIASTSQRRASHLLVGGSIDRVVTISKWCHTCTIPIEGRDARLAAAGRLRSVRTSGIGLLGGGHAPRLGHADPIGVARPMVVGGEVQGRAVIGDLHGPVGPRHLGQLAGDPADTSGVAVSQEQWWPLFEQVASQALVAEPGTSLSRT